MTTRGRLVSQTDAKLQTVELSYDPLGRVKQRRGGGVTLASFAYDEPKAGFFNVGRMTTMTDASGSEALDYDRMGRVIEARKVIGSETFVSHYSYNLAGRLQDLTYPDGEVVSHSYDAAGRLVGAGPYLSGTSYDARGKVVGRTLGNGVVEAYTYHPTRFWLGTKTVSVGSVTIDDLSFTYSERGELTGKSDALDAQNSWAFGYDDLGRLTSAANAGNADWTQTLSYDAIGRLTHQSGVGDYGYPAVGAPRPHAPVTVGAVPLSYDQNGNRLTSGGTSYSYDVQNRLVSDGVTTFVYDGNGDRVKAGSKTFVGNLVEIDGGVVRKYYFAGGRRLARRDADGSVFYFHGDQIGTVQKVTDQAGGGGQAGDRLAVGDRPQPELHPRRRNLGRW